MHDASASLIGLIYILYIIIIIIVNTETTGLLVGLWWREEKLRVRMHVARKKEEDGNLIQEVKARRFASKLSNMAATKQINYNLSKLIVLESSNFY